MKKLSASKCAVIEVSVAEAESFIEAQHRSGKAKAPKSGSVSLGLFYDGALLAIAQFCSPRTSEKQRKYTVELLRMAFHSDYRIHGGASKLIKSYIETYKPSDLFTYQDTTGETTDVYEKCGMVLVSQEKAKQYLVKDGLSLETAKRREYWSIAEVSRRGPDALLGTRLGEQFHPDGKRKTNPELFLELGWHIEETTGDRVYEWFNSNLTFYVYKITATDSDKYYIGVRQIPKGSASLKDCQEDKYLGSGGSYPGNKFGNWKKKHKATLHKEVLAVYGNKAQAYNKEKELVGDLWKTDPLCLNSRSGGFVGENRNFKPALNISLKTCPIHGEVKHAGDKCCTCTRAKGISLRECPVHGESFHEGSGCAKCKAVKVFSVKSCPTHGPTSHQGDTCKACISSRSVTKKKCAVHGISKHIGDKCFKCSSDKKVSLKECPEHGNVPHTGNTCFKCVSKRSMATMICSVHGETVHRGESCLACISLGVAELLSPRICSIHGESLHRGRSCMTCVSQAGVSLKVCLIHGETKHRGDFCYSCLMGDRNTVEECPIHGERKFQDGVCSSCKSFARVSVKKCSIHGMAKHSGDTCYICTVNNAISEKKCPTHGIVAHRGDSCVFCTAGSAVSIKQCPQHGDTKHFGNSCRKCSLEKQIEVGICPTHGEVKHRAGKCYLCQNTKSVNQKQCPTHGLTKHQGDKCSRCTGMLNAHKRFHIDKINPDCPSCQAEQSE